MSAKIKNQFPFVFSYVAFLFLHTHSAPLLANDISFGKADNGLAVGILLDRSRIRPGKRLVAHVFVQNQTDQPIKLVAPHPETIYARASSVPHLLGWRVEHNMRSCRVTSEPTVWHPALKNVISVSPNSYALLQSEQLESGFNLANDGEYKISYTLSLGRSHLPDGKKGDEILATLKEKGIWFGKCRSPESTLVVTPEANVHGSLRNSKIKIQTIDRSSVWVKAKQGDSILYRGQVLSTTSGKRLRLHKCSSDHSQWEAKPIAPLKLSSLDEGQVLTADEEDFHWMRSVKNKSPVAQTKKLKLELKMKNSKLTSDDGWEGEVYLHNVDSSPVFVSTLAKLDINLVTQEGSPPEILTCIGRGLGFGAKEIEQSRIKLEPGKKILMLKLEKPATQGNLGGGLGDKWVTWDAKKGKYQLSFRYSMSLRLASQLNIKPVFAGILESNVVTVTVD